MDDDDKEKRVELKTLLNKPSETGKVIAQRCSNCFGQLRTIDYGDYKIGQCDECNTAKVLTSWPSGSGL